MTGPRTARVLNALVPLLSRGIRFAPGGVEFKAGEFRVLVNTLALGGQTLHHPERPGLPVEPQTVYVERGGNSVAWFPLDTGRTGTDWLSHPDAPNDGNRSKRVDGVPRTGSSLVDPDTLAEALETAGKGVAA